MKKLIKGIAAGLAVIGIMSMGSVALATTSNGSKGALDNTNYPPLEVASKGRLYSYKNALEGNIICEPGIGYDGNGQPDFESSNRYGYENRMRDGNGYSNRMRDDNGYSNKYNNGMRNENGYKYGNGYRNNNEFRNGNGVSCGGMF